MSTVLPTGRTLPVKGSGARSPDHATSNIFSKLWPLFDQPLTTWMRSRLPDVGSFTAQTMKVGALAFGAGRSAPIGTPFAYPVFVQSVWYSTPGVKFQPPKNRT